MQDEVSQSQILMQELEKRREEAEEFKELKLNPSFQKLFLKGYLGNRYSSLGDQILQAIGRGEDCDDKIEAFRVLHGFKEYMAYLEQGERSWLYQDLYKKMEDGTMGAEEITQILGAMNE